MAFDAGTIVGTIKANIEGFKKGIEEVKTSATGMADKVKGGIASMNSTIEKFSPQLKKASLGFAAFGAAGVLAIRDWAQAAGGAEVAMAKFNKILENTGKGTQEVKDKILGAAGAAVKLGFDDEDAALSMATLFQRTGDVNKAMELNRLAMDLARAKSIDLGSATTLVGQVLSGNGKVLKQYGIDIKDAATPLEALGELQTVVGGQAAAFGDTFEGKMEIISNRIGNFKESLGEALLPVLEQLLDWGSKLVGWLENLSPGMVKVIAVTVLVATALATVLAPILALVAFLPSIAAGFGMVATAIGIIFSPIGIIIGALGLLFLAWQTNFLGIQDLVTLLGMWIRDGFAVVSQVFQDWMVVVQDVLNALMPIFQFFWDTIGLQLQFFIALLTGDWATAWKKAQQIFELFRGAVLAIGGTLWSGMQAVFESGKALLTAGWQAFCDGLSGIMSSVWEGIKSVFKSGINWVIEKLNSVINSYSAVVGKIPGVGKRLVIPSIPYLAAGGIVTQPTVAMIGEAGPEAVVPLDRAGSMGIGGGITFGRGAFEGAIISSKEVAMELLDAAFADMRPRLGV